MTPAQKEIVDILEDLVQGLGFHFNSGSWIDVYPPNNGPAFSVFVYPAFISVATHGGHPLLKDDQFTTLFEFQEWAIRFFDL